MVRPKSPIPKWINELYISNNISQKYFFELSKQYLLLETAINILNSNEFISVLEKKIASLASNTTLIISFKNSKLFYKEDVNNESLYIMDLENKIKNFNTEIKDLINEKKWFFHGYYIDFINEFDLLKELDEKQKLNLKELFQNDYLFLNNCEFFTEEYNTLGWESNFIVSPYLCDFSKGKIDNSNFKTQMLYFYIKKEDGAIFYRNELLFSNKNIEIGDILKLINISFDIQEDYEPK
jgi:hypothetical protein